MSFEIIKDDFEQAKAMLRDVIYKSNADLRDRNSIGVLKLIKAREENLDFELQLAERICGDNSNYPYRSSFYITKFFSDLGYNISHDGSTRRLWIKEQLYQLDTQQISEIIKNGIFKKADYKNQKLRTIYNKEISDEDFIESAMKDFRKFIEESTCANEVVELSEILNLSLNMDLLFENQPDTKDGELNKLISEAKERYLKPNDQNIALEKLWDAFERIKTYYGANKKTSVNILINNIASDIDASEFTSEFEALTKIGNAYRIRHHEVDKKPISDPLQIKYLFFRMLSLIDLAIDSLQEKDLISGG